MSNHQFNVISEIIYLPQHGDLVNKHVTFSTKHLFKNDGIEAECQPAYQVLVLTISKLLMVGKSFSAASVVTFTIDGRYKICSPFNYSKKTNALHTELMNTPSPCSTLMHVLVDQATHSHPAHNHITKELLNNLP